MNQSEFAALHSVSRKTVTKWKERGWLVFEGNSLDVDASNALIAKYRRDGSDVVTQEDSGNSSAGAATMQGIGGAAVTLSASGLAFLAGYGVEAAFNLLDMLIKHVFKVNGEKKDTTGG